MEIWGCKSSFFNVQAPFARGNAHKFVSIRIMLGTALIPLAKMHSASVNSWGRSLEKYLCNTCGRMQVSVYVFENEIL
jgi:hypothetical protein